MDELQQILQDKHGIKIDANMIELLQKDLDAVAEKNKILNLTRIESEEEARIKHIEDSLVALPLLQSAPEGLYADLGTGGGFPGIPLAICSLRKTVLVDSVNKKIAAVRDIVKELGLEDRIECWSGRIEDFGSERKGQFAVVTARALTSLNSLIELASPLLQQGGVLICFKANLKQEELQEALEIADIVAVRFRDRIDFELSDGSKRCFVVFEKKGKPRIKLPRRIGLAQHQPLKPR